MQRLKNSLKDIILIVLGVLSATIGLKSFLIPNGFLDGGVMGISLLTNALFGISLPILIFLYNTPFIIMGYKQISLSFSIKTLFAIIALSLSVKYMEFSVVTDDKLLISIFGGFFLGTGIGFSIRGGGVIDGTEVLAVYISRRSSLTVGDVILIINIIIFTTAIFLINVEIAMYAIITYLIAAKTIDFIVHGIEEYTSMTIISTKSNDIRKKLIEKQTGVTILKGQKGFTKNTNIDILYTIVTRLEITSIKNEIDAIDPDAFIIQTKVDDTRGGMVKKKSFSEKKK